MPLFFPLGRRAAPPIVLPSLLLVLAAGPASAAFQAAAPRPHPTVRIDGVLDDAAWAQAPVNSRFHQFEPQDARAAPDAYRTAVRMLADEHALTFAIRAWHPGPAPLNGTLARRDKVGRDQDYIGIFLDPSGHGRSAQFVRVNVAGVLADGIYRTEEDTEDFGPDFPIEAAVTRLPDGFSMEVRWPLSSLRFPYRGTQPWRVMIERSAPAADGMLLLSVPLRKDALNHIAAMEELQGVEPVLAAAGDKAYWEVRPELTVRRTRGPGERADAASLGVDINARPRADLVFNATLNPDFSQVEIDEPTNAGASQIALSLPEKRAFFLESGDVLGMRLPAFYSRTVADPRWGARLTWRGAAQDATALVAQDRAGGVVMRGTPYSTEETVSASTSRATLLRARWHGTGTVGGVFASRRDYGNEGGHPGGANTVLGADLRHNFALFSGHTQATLGAMRSQTSAWFDAADFARSGEQVNGSYGFARVQHNSDDWFNAMQVEVIGAGFVNDNGFLPQSAIVKTAGEFSRRIGPRRLGPGPAFDTYETELYLGLFEDRTLADARLGLPGGEVVRRFVRPGFWAFGARQTRVWGDLGFDQQRARTGGVLHRVPALHLGFESAPLPWLIRVAGEMALGRQLDAEADRVGRGGNVQLELNMRFAMAGGWSVESDHRFNRAWIRHADGQDFTDHAWRWVGTLHMGVRTSLRAIVQNAGAGRADASGAIGVLKPWTERSSHRSLLYRYIHRHGRSVSLGATSDANGELPGAVRGVTVKLQWES